MSIDTLYKYGCLNEYSEALFSTPQIYFQSPSKLNDPFELRPFLSFNGTASQKVELYAQGLRQRNEFMTKNTATENAVSMLLSGSFEDPQAWERVRVQILKMLHIELGLYCMAERKDNILLWSHYAEHHTGYCLEFEATENTPVFGAAQQVEYKKGYPCVDFFNTPNDEQVDLMFLTKYKRWKYEKEWRIIDHETGSGEKEYPAELLKSVIFGIRMNENDKRKIRKWISRRGTDVKFYNARQHDRKYKIIIDEAL